MRYDLALKGQFEAERKLIGFVVGEVLYGIDIMSVREIIKPVPLVNLPTAPQFVIGFADHRSEVVPVIDVRQRFGLAAIAPSRHTKWLLAVVNEHEVGLMVDQVTEVLRVKDTARRQQPELLQKADSPWIKAVYGNGDLLIFEIDLAEVVGPLALLCGQEAQRERGD